MARLGLALLFFIAQSAACSATPSQPSAKALPVSSTPWCPGPIPVENEPWVVGIERSVREALRGQRERGMIAVRYLPKSCQPRLKVLPNCHGTERYRFVSLAGEERQVVQQVEERREWLPLSSVQTLNAVQIDSVQSGLYVLAPGIVPTRAQLIGECAEATHVVSQLAVGAYTLREKSLPGAAARLLDSEGEWTACYQSQAESVSSPSCDSPLRLVLLPLVSSGSEAMSQESESWRVSAQNHLERARELRRQAFLTEDAPRAWLLRDAQEAYEEADREESRYVALYPADTGTYDALFYLAEAREGALLTRAALADTARPGFREDSSCEPVCHRNACTAIRPQAACSDPSREERCRCQERACAIVLEADLFQRALAPAVAVRDSDSDARHRAEAATFVIELGQRFLEEQSLLFTKSGGKLGLRLPTTLRYAGEGREGSVVEEPIPPQLATLILALDAYQRRVSPDLDRKHRRMHYLLQSAQYYFFQGAIEEARKRYEVVYAQECGRAEPGYAAWEKLLVIATLRQEWGRTTELAAKARKQSCAMTELQKQSERALLEPVLQELSPQAAARKAFLAAEKLPSGPAREAQWREAANRHRECLERAPGDSSAPEYALNGAYAYAQVRSLDEAIKLLELFLTHYADERSIAVLEKGDPRAVPPQVPDPERYAERVKYVAQAFLELARLERLAGEAERAVDVSLCVARYPRFRASERQLGACQVLASLAGKQGDPRRKEAQTIAKTLRFTCPKQKAANGP